MSRLPSPGSDDGQWGTILNDFLAVEHNADGSLKIRTDGTLSGGGVSDATTTSKGIVQLAGDLGGTAASPTVPGLATLQTALNAKAADNAVVHLTGTETVTGNKTFTGASKITISDTTTQALRIDVPSGDRTSAGAPDTMAFYYGGSRTGYFNEYGEIRVIASANNRVPLRVKQANGGGQTADLIQATDISNNPLFSVASDGTVTAPNLTASSWQSVTFNVDASSSGTYATVGVRKEPLYGLARLRGGVAVGGDGLTGSETLITLPVGYRPVSTFSCGVRIAGSNVARQIVINTDGTVNIASSLAIGDTVLLDGIVFPIS